MLRRLGPLLPVIATQSIDSGEPEWPETRELALDQGVLVEAFSGSSRGITKINPPNTLVRCGDFQLDVRSRPFPSNWSIGSCGPERSCSAVLGGLI